MASLYFRKILLVALRRGTQLCHPRDGKGLSHNSNNGGRGGAGVKSIPEVQALGLRGRLDKGRKKARRITSF